MTKGGDKVLFVFGAEGGTSPAEIDNLIQAGFKTLALGFRILRAETAPLYALAAVAYVLGLQG